VQDGERVQPLDDAVDVGTLDLIQGAAVQDLVEDRLVLVVAVAEGEEYFLVHRRLTGPGLATFGVLDRLVAQLGEQQVGHLLVGHGVDRLADHQRQVLDGLLHVPHDGRPDVGEGVLIDGEPGPLVVVEHAGQRDLQLQEQLPQVAAGGRSRFEPGAQLLVRLVVGPGVHAGVVRHGGPVLRPEELPGLVPCAEQLGEARVDRVSLVGVGVESVTRQGLESVVRTGAVLPDAHRERADHRIDNLDLHPGVGDHVHVVLGAVGDLQLVRVLEQRLEDVE
jgi:hypothetical protein